MLLMNAIEMQSPPACFLIDSDGRLLLASQRAGILLPSIINGMSLALGCYLHAPALALSNACPKSSRISSICSMPTLSRIISGVTPTCACSSGVSCRCVVDAGWHDSDLASPIFTIRLNRRKESKHLMPPSYPPFTPKVSKEQKLEPR